MASVIVYKKQNGYWNYTLKAKDKPPKKVFIAHTPRWAQLNSIAIWVINLEGERKWRVQIV